MTKKRNIDAGQQRTEGQRPIPIVRAWCYLCEGGHVFAEPCAPILRLDWVKVPGATDAR